MRAFTTCHGSSIKKFRCGSCLTEMSWPLADPGPTQPGPRPGAWLAVASLDAGIATVIFTIWHCTYVVCLGRHFYLGPLHDHKMFGRWVSAWEKIGTLKMLFQKHFRELIFCHILHECDFMTNFCKHLKLCHKKYSDFFILLFIKLIWVREQKDIFGRGVCAHKLKWAQDK